MSIARTNKLDISKFAPSELLAAEMELASLNVNPFGEDKIDHLAIEIHNKIIDTKADDIDVDELLAAEKELSFTTAAPFNEEKIDRITYKVQQQIEANNSMRAIEGELKGLLSVVRSGTDKAMVIGLANLMEKLVEINVITDLEDELFSRHPEFQDPPSGGWRQIRGIELPLVLVGLFSSINRELHHTRIAMLHVANVVASFFNKEIRRLSRSPFRHKWIKFGVACSILALAIFAYHNREKISYKPSYSSRFIASDSSSLRKQHKDEGMYINSDEPTKIPDNADTLDDLKDNNTNGISVYKSGAENSGLISAICADNYNDWPRKLDNDTVARLDWHVFSQR